MLYRLFFAAAFCSLALAFAGCGGEGQGNEGAQDRGEGRAQPVEATEIAVRTLTESIRLTGSVAANESVLVRPEIAGQIRRIAFEEGQEVVENDVLVELDDRELRAELREARVRGELARQTLERMDTLRQTRAVPVSDYDRARAENEQALAQIELLEARLEKTVIRAPFNGTAGARQVSPGDFVTSSDVITRIEDLHQLKLEFTVPERHAARVSPETRVTIGRTGFDSTEPVEVKIYFVSPTIDRATRSVETKALIDSPPPGIRPGMFAEIELVLAVHEDVLTVPEGAILARNGAHTILLIREGDDGGETIAMEPVQIGLRERGFVEIRPVGENLRAGQRVVAAGVGALPLFPGAAVESRPLKIAPEDRAT